jgi:hypothetical protein
MPKIRKSLIVLPLLVGLALTGCASAHGVSAGDAEHDADAAKTSAPVAAKTGTFSNPAPAGTTVQVSDVSGAKAYNVVVGPAVLDYNAQVAAANMFNDAPKPGMQYASFPVTITYIGKTSGTPAADIDIDFVAADGTTHKTTDALATIDNDLFAINELYPGATGTANIVILIPTADAAKGKLAVSGILGTNKYFLAVA